MDDYISQAKAYEKLFKSKVIGKLNYNSLETSLLWIGQHLIFIQEGHLYGANDALGNKLKIPAAITA